MVNESQLGELLERATDGLPVRERATTALERARTIRRRRRALAVAGVAAAVAAVVASPLLLGEPGGRVSLEPAPSTVGPNPQESAAPNTGSAIDPLAVPAWDPFSLRDAQPGSSVLPGTLDPPDDAPSVLEQPLPAAVVAWPEEGRDLRLLGSDGAWRSLPGTASSVTGTLRDVVTPELTSDGQQVAMSTNDGILVVDITRGTRRLLPWPDEIAPPWDTAPPLLWLPGDDELLVQHWKHPWIVGLDGSDRAAPYRGPYGAGVFVDPDGPVRQWQWDANQLVEWEGDRIVRRVTGNWWGERYVSGHGLVAFTGAFLGDTRNGPAVVRADNGQVVAYAPIEDPNSAYSDNGYLTAQAFLDDHTLLILMAPVHLGDPDRVERWYLVTWDFNSGEFRRLSSGDSRMRAMDVAAAAVR